MSHDDTMTLVEISCCLKNRDQVTAKIVHSCKIYVKIRLLWAIMQNLRILFAFVSKIKSLCFVHLLVK